VTLRRRHDIWDIAIVGGGIAGLTAAFFEGAADGLTKYRQKEAA
jgi:thioredoxin reductase